MGSLSYLICREPINIYAYVYYPLILVANAIVDSNAVTIVGRGDTLSAIKKFGVEGKFSHVSSGGDTLMEFLTGKVLPGITKIENINNRAYCQQVNYTHLLE